MKTNERIEKLSYKLKMLEYQRIGIEKFVEDAASDRLSPHQQKHIMLEWVDVHEAMLNIIGRLRLLSPNQQLSPSLAIMETTLKERLKGFYSLPDDDESPAPDSVH